MRKLYIAMMCIAAMMAAGTSAKAQVTITLKPGWTWIGSPTAEEVDYASAFGSFTPQDGDIIKSQGNTSFYISGWGWAGTVTKFEPGIGYKYYSNRTEPVTVTFNLQQSTPPVEVTTLPAMDITPYSAIYGGSITTDAYVFAKGLCWAIHPDPTPMEDDHSENGSGDGIFTVEMTDLIPNTMYYVRAYAVSEYGLSYGEELSFATESTPMGTLNGLFSVSADQQVYFSQGNLQYQASTNTWKFAENQYDYIGDANSNISSTYSGWIDLFGWGTSGYNHGANCYQPWSTSESYSDYYAYGSGGYNLYDQNGQADWGYNSISNGGNTANRWRTLTKAEWEYVFFTRTTTSGIRYAKANVNNVNGVILLPDNWNASTYSLSNTNSSGASFSSNTLTASQWITLEQVGAVFLPAAGRRVGTSVDNVGSFGFYWSTSTYFSNSAYYVKFYNSVLETDGIRRYSGQSVRLVRVVEN